MAFQMLEEDFPGLNISKDDDSLHSFKNKMAGILDHIDKKEAERVRSVVEVSNAILVVTIYTKASIYFNTGTNTTSNYKLIYC